MIIDGFPFQIMTTRIYEDGRVEKAYSEKFDYNNPNTAFHIHVEKDGVMTHSSSHYCPYVPKISKDITE